MMRKMAQVLWGDLVFLVPFNFSEELLLSLNLEDHLAMDIFNVEVLAGNHEGTAIACDVVV